MKQFSQSIINATKSIFGRWTKVTTLGCMLALVCLGATSAQPQSSKQARPFKATGIYTAGDLGTFQVVGNATHLGKFVGKGTFELIDWNDNFSIVILHVKATWTAANGDTLELDFPEWVMDSTTNLSCGDFTILGGTGRFANATGSGISDITPFDITPGILNILTAEGTISY